ncbi:MAG: glycosyltransferase family 39 protein [Candidatus Lernaella stagnicola]|nr:glycosyltransferase family 39 protein [Candidatus Lernaella stagnicola]
MRSTFLRLLAILGAIHLVRLIVSLGVGIIPDEAYYWTWGLQLDWCYWDQPGGIAWLHGGWSALFGSGLVSLRVLATLCSLAGSLLVFGLVRRTIDEQTAFWAALLMQAVPLFGAGGALVMHDSLMLPLIAAAWWVLARTILDDRPRGWIVVGALLALALYAKLSAIIFAFGLVTTATLDPVGRRHFRSPWPYFGAATVAICVVPVIKWNEMHQWVTFFAVRKLAVDPDIVGWQRLLSLGDYLLAQLGIVSPILAVLGFLGALWAVRQRGEPSRGLRLLAVPALFIAAYFAVNSLRAKVQGNWPAVMWLGFLPLAIAYVKARGDRMRRVFVIGLTISLLGLIAVYLQALLGVVPLKPDMSDQSFGWGDVARQVQERRQSFEGVQLATKTYQTAAELRYHLPDHPPIYTADYAHRGSQFTLWQDFRNLAGRDVLFVEEGGMPRKFARHFEEVTELPPIFRLRGSKKVETLRVYHARNFRLEGQEAFYMRDPVGHHLERQRRRMERSAAP